MAIVPTQLDATFRDLASNLINAYGRTLMIERPVRVEIMTGVGTGGVNITPLSTNVVLANGASLSGTSTIGLRAATLTGLLVAGDTLLIGGNNYTVTGGPYVAADNTVGSVTITPALTTSVSDGDAITVSFTGTQYPITGVVEIFSLALINSQDSSIESGDFKVTFSKLDLDKLGIMPTTKDQLYNGPDTTYPLAVIISIDTLPSGQQDAAVVIHARTAK